MRHLIREQQLVWRQSVDDYAPCEARSKESEQPVAACAEYALIRLTQSMLVRHVLARAFVTRYTETRVLACSSLQRFHNMNSTISAGYRLPLPLIPRERLPSSPFQRQKSLTESFHGLSMVPR